MRMSISSDDDALESLPLRLLIVAAVAAMSIVPAAEALDTLQDRDFVSRAGLTMDEIIHTAQMLSMQGPGASRTVEVDLSSDGSLKAVRLVVGDDPDGAYTNALVLELSSGGRIIRIAQDPTARMASPSGDGLEVTSERFSLRMEAHLSGDRCIVSVEVV